jgi:hypothetical protein
MNRGTTLFAQVMAHAPHRDFQRCVQRYGGDTRVRRFSCWDHFLTLAFARGRGAGRVATASAARGPIAARGGAAAPRRSDGRRPRPSGGCCRRGRRRAPCTGRRSVARRRTRRSGRARSRGRGPWREDGVRAEVGRVAYRAGRTGHQLPDGSGSTADEERLDDGTWTKGSFA